MMKKICIFSLFALFMSGSVFCQPVFMNENDPNYCEIEYELFDGKNNPDNPTKVYLKDATKAEYNKPYVLYDKKLISLKDPVKTGYRFLYWYSNSKYVHNDSIDTHMTKIEFYNNNKDNNFIIKKEGVIPLGSIKLSAKWQKKIDLAPYIKDMMVTMIPAGKKATLESFAGTQGIQDINGYEIAKFEVTDELWETVFHAKDPENMKSGGYSPKTYITFYDACYFCNELTKLLIGESECCYDIQVYDRNSYNIYEASVYLNESKKGFRLPTRAEWEFAARGGTCGGWDTNGYANKYPTILTNTGDYIVGEREPNMAGLYDILGGASEMCWDSTTRTEKERFIRGFNNVKSENYVWTEKTYSNVGFRIVRSY